MVSHISNLISTKGKCVLTELEEIPVIERTEQVKEGSLPSLWLCCCVPSLVTHVPIDLKFKCDNCPSADVMTWLTYKFSEYHCHVTFCFVWRISSEFIFYQLFVDLLFNSHSWHDQLFAVCVLKTVTTFVSVNSCFFLNSLSGKNMNNYL